MKWRIVAFNHPKEEKSVVYRQNVSNEKLVDLVRLAIEKGANLMSIRGFCSHEWHADQDNDCNTCVKCGARQEIYTE